MEIDVVVASISCLGKFPTNHRGSTQPEAITGWPQGVRGGHQKYETVLINFIYLWFSYKYYSTQILDYIRRLKDTHYLIMIMIVF